MTIKLSRKQFEEMAFARSIYPDKDKLIGRHIRAKLQNEKWGLGCTTLQLFSIEDMGRMVYEGYELLKSPEEMYNEAYDEYTMSNASEKNVDFIAGMKFVAELFDLPVKGRV